MEFLIVGPGAMGCLFAARLNNAGFNVTLLDHNSKRAEEISRQGIIVEGASGNYKESVRVTADPADIKPDIILFCVKSGKTEEAAVSVKNNLHESTVAATLQNGLGNTEIIKKILGEDRVLSGITSEGATLLGNGRVKHAGTGSTVLGPVKGFGVRLAKTVEAFSKAGFQTSQVENVEDLIWGKLIINVGINALTAITGLKNGKLLKFEETLEIMKDAVNEAVMVSEAKNIKLPYDDPIKRVMEVCESTSDNVASMLQDVISKRPTEVDFINGAVCREGKIAGINTPVNLTLTRLIKAIHSSYSERTF